MVDARTWKWKSSEQELRRMTENEELYASGRKVASDIRAHSHEKLR
jgi:hypothetical protein